MRRWDRLLDSYIEDYRARGVSPQSVAYTQARLDRWGRWHKGRRPRIGIEHIDAEMITYYMTNYTSFRAKATVYATLSTMRGLLYTNDKTHLANELSRDVSHRTAIEPSREPEPSAAHKIEPSSARSETHEHAQAQANSISR